MLRRDHIAATRARRAPPSGPARDADRLSRRGSLSMAQHAQHLAGLATPRPQPWVPIAEPFRADLGADRLRPGPYRLTFRPDDGAATLHGSVRVAEHGSLMVAGGDLYRYPRVPGAR